MSTNEYVRQTVAEAYTKAVKEPGTGCYGGESCCGDSAAPKGVAAKVAGYTREELAVLPEDAVVNSFGCGNPLAFSEVKEGDVVLDLGSGAGIDILLAGKIVGETGHVIGIDMTDEMIDKAKENIAASGLGNVEVRKGIIEELPVESESVDWVISNCVINLSPEKDRVFAEIARVLKPGGAMQVSDLVANGLPSWVLESEALHNSCIAGAISEEEYLDGLRKAGLVNTKVLERLVYDLSQMKAFVESELPENLRGLILNTDGGKNLSINSIIETLEGKVWSAKIYAQKPES